MNNQKKQSNKQEGISSTGAHVGFMAESRTIPQRAAYFAKHLKYTYNDNKNIFRKYLIYSLGRALTYPVRRAEEAQDDGEERYQKAIKGKKEVLFSIFGNKMILPVDDKGLSRDLIIEGIREPSSVKVLWRELKRDMHVLDCGANLGYYLLMEAKILKGGKGKLYAVEPNPDAVKYIKKNLKVNGYKGVKVMNLAMSDKQGSAPFYIARGWNCSRFVKGDPSDIVKTKQMKIDTIDHVFKGKKVDFIRMDVEGYEFNILKGAVQTIEDNPGISIFFEYHAQFFNTKQREAFISFLKQNGLKVKYLFRGDERNPKPWKHSYNDVRDALYTTYYLYLQSTPKKK